MSANNNKSVKNQIRHKIYDQLWNHTRNRIWYYDCDKAWDQIGTQTRVPVWEYIWDSVWDQVKDYVDER